MKTALITGINGQDGSYMAEYLSGMGYRVYGTVRGKNPCWPLRFNPNKYTLVHLDLNNPQDFAGMLQGLPEPIDELYNFAAQSHVGESFLLPEETYRVTGVGACLLMYAFFRVFPQGKFYQASTSELFGGFKDAPDSYRVGDTFHPQSPYALAKLMAHECVSHYATLGMNAYSAILFNHETVAGFMPMFVKNNGEDVFDLKPISEIVQFDEQNETYQAQFVSGIQVWGKSGWVDVKFASAYPHNVVSDPKHPRFINARCGAYMATASHVAFLKTHEEKTGNICIGDEVETIELPYQEGSMEVSCEEAELIGMMVADGSITYAKQGTGVHAKFTKNDPVIRERFLELWHKVTGGGHRLQRHPSGFKKGNFGYQLCLAGGNDWLRSLDLYTKDHKKRIPKKIINATVDVAYAFLKGYNTCDGLKQNSCVYEFKNFKTNSATLAMGLWFLIRKTTNQEMNLTIETKPDGRLFYSLNLRSDNPRGKSGFGFVKNNQEVKKIIEMPEYDGWFYDLETSSGEFHCGVGLLHVHNSPRRHSSFLTQKVVYGAVRGAQWARLNKAGLATEPKPILHLGNPDAMRDWGYASEYVEIIHALMQREPGAEYVIGTGCAVTVRDFVQETYAQVGLDYQEWVEFHSAELRPFDVPYLKADPHDANNLLGRETTKWHELIAIMLESAKMEHLWSQMG